DDVDDDNDDGDMSIYYISIYHQHYNHHHLFNASFHAGVGFILCKQVSSIVTVLSLNVGNQYFRRVQIAPRLSWPFFLSRIDKPSMRKLGVPNILGSLPTSVIKGTIDILRKTLSL
ncbi:LOW QUALITY PROTEIN: hypothetical protein Ahia01_000801900, partial [Argonauta hians]